MNGVFMDFEMEKLFVKRFVSKDMRERFLFELSSKKREFAILRFSHQLEHVINLRTLMFKEKSISEKTIYDWFLKNCKYAESAYVMSCNKFDGSILPIKKAIEICLNDYMPSVVMVDGHCVLIKEEVTFGSSEKYFLMANQ